MKTPKNLKTLLCSTLVAVLAMVMLGGCASGAGVRDAERLGLYRAHAGEPVNSIYYPGYYNGWTPLGDGALALWTRPSQAWLLELHGPCSEIEYADRIGIPQHNGRLSARFDRITVSSHGSIPLQCTIREIRPLDVKAIRAAEKEARAQRQSGA